MNRWSLWACNSQNLSRFLLTKPSPFLNFAKFLSNLARPSKIQNRVSFESVGVNRALFFCYRLTHQKCKKIYELKKWKAIWHDTHKKRKDGNKNAHLFPFWERFSFATTTSVWHARVDSLVACFTVFFYFRVRVFDSRCSQRRLTLPPTFLFLLLSIRKHKRKLSNNPKSKWVRV